LAVLAAATPLAKTAVATDCWSPCSDHALGAQLFTLLSTNVSPNAFTLLARVCADEIEDNDSSAALVAVAAIANVDAAVAQSDSYGAGVQLLKRILLLPKKWSGQDFELVSKAHAPTQVTH